MTITTNDIYLGAVVHTDAFPFEEDPTQTKPRPVFIIGINQHSVIVRGIFSNPGRDRHAITLDDANRLHHDSYLDNRLVELSLNTITHHISDTDPYYDPYNDFPN